MRIHAGTLGTLLREVGRSLSGHDQVFVPGKIQNDGTPYTVRGPFASERKVF